MKNEERRIDDDTVLRSTFYVLRSQRLSRRNWPLLIGGGLVLLVALVTLAGPVLAPRDPLAREAVFKVGDRFYPPPFPAFLSAAFPFGSDSAGRDLLSRLLWGMQPTMVMVMIVALVRLALGVSIGMVAGWSDGPAGRLARAALGVAQAVPILLVALAAIIVVGIERGLVAFIAGLALTGWSEAGRLVREQTALVRRQPYIDAARALGASSFHLVVRHVRRQISPLLGMLLAFEVSATLLVVGALGFLGYYIGGGVLVQMDDSVTRRFAELPELGQLLATSLEQTIRPTPMVIVGTTVFLIVLGFNLLGEGLRREAQQVSRSPFGRAAGQVSTRIEEALLTTTASWGRGTAWLAGVLALALFGLGGLAWWHGQVQPLVAASALAPTVPAAATLVPSLAQIWSSERRDPQGTMLAPLRTPVPNPGVSWTFQDTSGFAGGPAVAGDGTVYLATSGGVLYALGPDGTQRWRADVPGGAVGTPALDPSGAVFVAELGGGLSAFTPDGALRWRFQSSAGRQATSGPVVGPDGTLYYTVVDRIQAVRPSGQARWITPAVDGYLDSPPVLSPAGDLVFLQDHAFSVADGRLVDLRLEDQPELVPDATLLVGANGRNYYLARDTLLEWHRTPGGVTRGAAVELTDGPRAPAGSARIRQAGVLPDGGIWAHCLDLHEANGLCWRDRAGRSVSELRLPGMASSWDARGTVRVIAVDQDEMIYMCGASNRGKSACVAASPRATAPVWEVPLAEGRTISGGALAPGRLYVATREGFFYAIGDGPARL